MEEVDSSPRPLGWLLVLWVVTVAVGLGVLAEYSFAPGEPADPPERWPVESAVRPLPGTYTLVMLAHPRCPCTRASITELARLMASATSVRAHVLLLEPRGADEGFSRTDLRTTAEFIPGVEVHSDGDALEAARFGALTSGQVVLYSPEGRLVFAGGITAGRGHEGPNTGTQRLRALLRGHDPSSHTSPVFGCALQADGETLHPESESARVTVHLP